MNRRIRGRHEFEGTTFVSVAKEFLFRARRSPTEAVRLFLGETIWHWDTSNMAAVNRRIVLSLRMLYLVGRRFVSARAQRQAMALTYTTMLALVPAFAIMVAVFSMRGLGGMKMRLQGFAIEALSASPEQERLLTQWLGDLVSNMQGTGGVAGTDCARQQCAAQPRGERRIHHRDRRSYAQISGRIDVPACDFPGPCGQ